MHPRTERHLPRRRDTMHLGGGTPTPAQCTMHLGAPVVPDENMMKRGWLKGSCSNSSCGAGSPRPVARKSSRNTLWAKGRETNGGSGMLHGLRALPAHVEEPPMRKGENQGTERL